MSSSPFTCHFSKPFQNCFCSYWVQILELTVPWKYWLRNATSLADDRVLRHSTKSRRSELRQSLQFFPVICMRGSLRTGQIVHLRGILIASPTLSGTMKNILARNPYPQKIFIFSFHVVYGRMDVYGLSTGAAGMILCSIRSFQARALWCVRWKVSWHVEFKIVFGWHSDDSRWY